MGVPKLIKVRQHFESQHVSDIEGTVRDQINGLYLEFKPGASIAIAVGSRGIANISRIVKATVETLKAKGAKPFIVPAMGSHGGASGEGQREVLASYGVTEEFTGAPIRSSMQVVELPGGDLKNKVFMDRNAYLSDGVVVINRVKVHTDFHSSLESGMMKMCVIGLGKRRQAEEIHQLGVRGLKELIVPTARQVLKAGKVIMGIGIVENAYDQTMIIKAVLPTEMETEEKKLLDINRKNMPCLPVDKLDVLIVDKMGKDISGVGIDSNIIGRFKIKGEQDPRAPDITNIVVADITEPSHGNALGIGLADFTTKKLFDKIDFDATYKNVLTSTFIERGKIPIVADNDLQAVEYAMRTCGPVSAEQAKIIRIKNTLHLSEIYVSQQVKEELKNRNDIDILGEYEEMFDSDGYLTEFD